MSIEDIFKEILARMLKGLMTHEQLANYYDFLGLQGYKKCHECHFYEESKCYRKFYHYFIKRYNKLLPELNFENPNVIPINWYNYTRQDVDTKTKRSAVEQGLNVWVNWEKETLDLYQRMYQNLMNLGEVAAANELCKIIKEVEEELQTAEKYQLNKMAVNYDISVIIDEQKPYHKKYKKKMQGGD